MGSTTYSSSDWKDYSSSTSSKSVHENFKTRELKDSLNPAMFDRREARDSDIHPVTTPILVALDVTGSMGSLAQQIATKGLGVIFEELLSRKPVQGPQFAFAGIGDASCDRAPLQLSQFESSTPPITEQLKDFWLEGRGGGNNYESYNLPWYAALNMISHDAFEVRGKKGYLFTLGDEETPRNLTVGQIKQVFGRDVQHVPTNEEMLDALSEQWHVFHIMVEQGSYMRSPHSRESAIQSWTDLMGQRVLMLNDINSLSEVIVSTIQVLEGETIEDVSKSWSGSTAVAVAHAIKGLEGTSLVANSNSLVRFS